jgi:hypothetical protein
MKKRLSLLLLLAISLSALAFRINKLCSCSSAAITYGSADGTMVTVATGYAWYQPAHLACSPAHMVGSGAYAHAMSVNGGEPFITDQGSISSPTDIGCNL